MTVRFSVRLSDESAAYIEGLVAQGLASSRSAAIDRLVSRERRRQRALQDAAIYAQHREDPGLTDFHEAAAKNRRTRGYDLDL